MRLYKFNYLCLQIIVDFSDDLNFEDAYCGKKGPGIQYSTTNHMFLHFSTNDVETHRGFELVISSICKGILMALIYFSICVEDIFPRSGQLYVETT